MSLRNYNDHRPQRHTEPGKLENHGGRMTVSTPLHEKILQFGAGEISKKSLRSLTWLPGYFEAVPGSAVVVLNESRRVPRLAKPGGIPIGRVLIAREQWPEVMSCAANPELQVIFLGSGLIRKDLFHDKIHSNPPFSLPGKLLAILFHRFIKFGGDPNRGFTIVSSGHGDNSPDLVESIVLELAHLNDLEPRFLDWIENSNHFYGG